MRFAIGQQLDVDEFERDFPDRRLIAKFTNGAYEISLYHLKEDNVYLAKGPYARWDAVCYQVCRFNDEEGEKRWIESATKSMKRIV